MFNPYKISPTFQAPVRFEIPGDGEPIAGEFTGIFKRLPQSRIDALLDPETRPKTEAFAREVLAGWQDIADDAGRPLEFSELALNSVLEVPGMRLAISVAFISACLSAGPAAKNSQTPPASGRQAEAEPATE